MGPRPFGRGRTQHVFGLPRHRISFNGAATFRPRKVLSEIACDRTIECFNGAATFRPRKALYCRPAARSSPSFNGAATFRPRKAPNHGRF